MACAGDEKYKCEHEDCNEIAYPLYYPSDEAKCDPFYYCKEHMEDEGFCRGCHNYMAGVGNFEFNENGLCDDCKNNPDHISNYNDNDNFDMLYFNEDFHFEP